MSTSKNTPSEGTDGAKAPHENGSAAVNGESDGQEVNGKAVTDTTDAGDTSKFSRLDSSTIKLEHGYETLLREQRQRMPKLPDIPVSSRSNINVAICHHFDSGRCRRFHLVI